MNRRALGAAIGASLMAVGTPTLLAQTSTTAERAKQAFERWLRRVTPNGGQGMVQYMSFGQGVRPAPSVSTVATAYLLQTYLQLGETAKAIRLGTALAGAQRLTERTAAQSVRGGMPTQFQVTSSGLKPGDYFYAGDCLLVIDALLRLTETTQVGRYTESALAIARWLESTLFDGVRLGLWRRNFGPAMQYMRSDGAANNAIHTGMAQAAQGCWYDHFVPSGETVTAGTWQWWQGGQATIGDNNLRSALAAAHFDWQDQCQLFDNWVKPAPGGLLWGYLDPSNCQPKYLPTDTPYFDVVCTGLLRSWHRKRNSPAVAALCQDTLNGLQSQNGGWHWGIKSSNRQALNPQQSTIVGCWALADVA
jgi:hypothetical protein